MSRISYIYVWNKNFPNIKYKRILFQVYRDYCKKGNHLYLCVHPYSEHDYIYNKLNHNIVISRFDCASTIRGGDI